MLYAQKYQQTQPNKKTILYEVPCKPWEVDDANLFLLKLPQWIVDYYGKLSNVKKANSLAATDLATTAKIFFTKCGLPQKIILDAGTNFISDMFQNCADRWTSYHHQSNHQVEVCIKFIKCTI